MYKKLLIMPKEIKKEFLEVPVFVSLGKRPYGGNIHLWKT